MQTGRKALSIARTHPPPSRLLVHIADIARKFPSQRT